MCFDVYTKIHFFSLNFTYELESGRFDLYTSIYGKYEIAIKNQFEEFLSVSLIELK